jgi:hypothetical protein
MGHPERPCSVGELTLVVRGEFANAPPVERCLACEADAVGTPLGRAFRRPPNVKTAVTRFGLRNFGETCFRINAQRSPTDIGLALVLHSPA